MVRVRDARLAAILAGLVALPAAANDAEIADEIEVTATRLPEPADLVPAALSTEGGPALRARGANTLPSVLGLIAGVDAPPGGDAGPQSAVPAFWGLHEFDAFLLVQDGVPWGGTYNPAIATLDLTDVARVDVLKGAAPVTYGATSFVGVVHVEHYPAGEAAREADLAIGNYGSVDGSASLVLPAAGAYRQSLAVSGHTQGFTDPRERIASEHALYRGAYDGENGTFTVDLDAARTRDAPPSPVLRAGAGLTTLTPVDANFNPADARLDEDRDQIALGYTRRTAVGTWDSRVSMSHADVTDVRAFLHPDLSGTADSQDQRRHIDDVYLDTHLLADAPADHGAGGDTDGTAAGLSWVVGADGLFGRARQQTLNGNSGFTVPLDGSVLPPPAAAIPVTEIGALDDHRAFLGQYVEVGWRPGERWNLTGGMRLNEVEEHKNSSDLVTTPFANAAADVRQRTVRPTETLGASVRLAGDGRADHDEAVAFADWRSAFKPAAIDFGPDYTPDLLAPETARSVEVGLRGRLDDGRLRYQAEWFRLDFHDLVVATPTGALANAGAELLTGGEAELHYATSSAVEVIATAAYHDATYTRYQFFDGTATVDVSGRRLPLSSRVLATTGVLYTPAQGVGFTAVARYTGPRFLDEQNSARVGGFTTLDATLFETIGRVRISLEASNLTNRRPPVTASEFGSQSYYLLPARMGWLRIAYSWG